MAQLWIDITRQLLFECVREFALHDIETEFEGTKQVAQCILHRLVDCFIIATIMSERPQFTDKSPVGRKDGHVDADEYTHKEKLSQNQKRMHLGAFAIEVLGLIKMPPLKKWGQLLRMLVDGSSSRYENGVDIAYGLNGSSVDMCVNVPSMYPLSAKQIEERRKLVAELSDPNFRQREQEFIQGMREAEQRRQSANPKASAS